MLPAEHIRLINTIYRLSQRAGFEVYIVGGLVRDLLLGSVEQSPDLDFMVVGDAGELATECNEELEGKIQEFPRFLTCKILEMPRFPSIKSIDFASGRLEIYPHPGSLPVVRRALSLAEDLGRRDFTVNAMAVELSCFVSWQEASASLSRLPEQIVSDPFGGLSDLRGGTLRVLHAQSFVDDPTRLFRACRYAARLGASLEDKTFVLARQAIEGQALRTISASRVLNEIRRICLEKKPASALLTLSALGALRGALLEGEGDSLKPALERLTCLPPFRDPEIAFELILSVIYACLDGGMRAQMISRYSLGKRRAERFERSIQGLRSKQGEGFCATPDSELLLRFCFEQQTAKRHELMAALLSRSLFKAEIVR